MSTPHSPFPPPVDDPERRATRAAGFEDPLDDTIDQSFPASDPPSTNPAPSYAAESASADMEASSVDESFGTRLHVRHEGLLWAAVGALGAAASMRLLGSRRGSQLFWQVVPAALMAGAAIAFAKQYARDDDPLAGC